MRGKGPAGVTGCGHNFGGGKISKFNARAKATRLKWDWVVQDYENDGRIRNCQKHGRTQPLEKNKVGGFIWAVYRRM